VCWRRALLFFFLGSGEREREGEQVLLTWALGPSADTNHHEREVHNQGWAKNSDGRAIPEKSNHPTTPHDAAQGVTVLPTPV
jgi:hypothetical protein